MWNTWRALLGHAPRQDARPLLSASEVWMVVFRAGYSARGRERAQERERSEDGAQEDGAQEDEEGEARAVTAKLSGTDRRLLYVLLRGSGVDEEGHSYALTAHEERLLRLVRGGYIEITLKDRAFEELSEVRGASRRAGEAG